MPREGQVDQQRRRSVVPMGWLWQYIATLLVLSLGDILFHTAEALDWGGVQLNADEGGPLTINVSIDGLTHIFTCREPCDAPESVRDFVERSFSSTIMMDVDSISRQIWRHYAIKEYLLTLRDGYARGAANRTNIWFEKNTIHLPGHLVRWMEADGNPGFITSHPFRILEIGSYEGGSTTWFQRHLLHHPGSCLVCIDPWQGWTKGVLERFKANIASYPNSEKVTAIQAEAIEGLSMLIAKGTPKFDFIYIDHLVELIFSFFCAPGRK